MGVMPQFNAPPKGTARGLPPVHTTRTSSPVTGYFLNGMSRHVLANGPPGWQHPMPPDGSEMTRPVLLHATPIVQPSVCNEASADPEVYLQKTFFPHNLSCSRVY